MVQLRDGRKIMGVLRSFDQVKGGDTHRERKKKTGTPNLHFTHDAHRRISFFPQFANLVLEHAVERLITGSVFADIPLGLYLVRGENVVWMGRLDPAADEAGPPGVARAPEGEVRRAAKAEREADKLKRGMKARMDFLDLE